MWTTLTSPGRPSSIFRTLDNLFQHTDVVRVTGRPRLVVCGEEDRRLSQASDGDSIHPAVEAFRRDDEIVVRAEVPGVEPDKLSVTVHKGQLVVRGEKTVRRESKEEEVFLQEFSHGHYERSFTLPEGVEADQLKATYQNGVVEITLPVRGPEEASVKVPISVFGGKATKKIA